MKITRDDISTTRTKLTITVEKDGLVDAEQVALNILKKDIKAPGFRKGKAPVPVAKKHIDPNTLAQETVENAMSKAVAEAFTNENIQVLERPSVELVSFVPNQELTFTAEATKLPPVKLGNYKKLKVSKQPNINVDNNEVDEIVGRILTSMAEKKSVSRKARDGDEVSIDFIGKKDGEVFDGGSAKNHTLSLGSESFIPGFEEAIIGHENNDKFDIPLKFPDDYHATELAGQDVVFSVTLNEVREVITPELTDEVAAKAGNYTSAKELREDIEREITRKKETEQRDALKDELVKQLIEKSEVDAPKLLIDDQVRSIEQDLTQNLMYQGISFDQYIKQKGYASKDEWIEKEARETAETRVKAGLVLAELTKAEAVTVSDAELSSQINELKTQYASQPDTAARFDEPEVQREVANRLLTDKTVDRLVKLNTK